MGNKERVLNRTERLFSLILLLQNRPNMTSRDLAEHFGVSRRTIFRDLRALSESGVPLTYAEGGGYEILEGYRLPPLMLSGREAATLLIGTEFMKLQSDASLRKDADQVGLKIRSVLPAEVVEYIDQLQKRTVLDPYWFRTVESDSDEQGMWFEISVALARQRSLLMEYYVESRDEITRRTVDPLGLVYYTDHWNLIGFDHLRKDIRNFRLENIRSLRTLNERFEPPAGFDLTEHLRERGASLHNYRIRIRFERSSYTWARKGIPAHLEEEIEEADAVSAVFYFENLEYVARWVLRFGARARIMEPPALQALVRQMAQDVVGLYDDLPVEKLLGEL